MKVVCPSCGREGSLRDSLKPVPQFVRCPSCKQKFRPHCSSQSAPTDGDLVPSDQESLDSDPDDSETDSEPLYSVLDPPPSQPVFTSPTRPEKEPWFYAFLWKEGQNIRFLAKVVWHLHVILYGIVVLVVIAILVIQGRKVFENLTPSSAAYGIGVGVLFTLAYFIAAYLEWYSLMTLAAWVLILVDQARNVRRSRMADEKLANL